MKKRIVAILGLLVLYSCTNTYPVFCTKYPVSFSCELSKPPFNSLNTLGYFLTVRAKATHDGYIVRFPDGSQQEYLYTEIQNRVFQFGLAGIIIGCPYFAEGTAYAYDLGCPQCDRSSVRLNVSTDGIASCAVCKSEYNLNNDGISETGSSRPLYRYQTTRNGAYLMIHN